MSTPAQRLHKAIRKSNAAGLAELREEHGDELSAEAATFNSVTVVDLDLSGLDLSNTEWDSCSLDRVDFSGANLEGAYLTGCMLLGCTFDDSNLEGASLEGCVLRRCTILSSRVAESEMSDLQLAEPVLGDLDLDGIEWRSIIINEGAIRNVRGQSGILNGMTLRGVDVDGFDTSGLTVERCTTTPLPNDAAPPAGFSVRAGRRRKI